MDIAPFSAMAQEEEIADGLRSEHALARQSYEVMMGASDEEHQLMQQRQRDLQLQ